MNTTNKFKVSIRLMCYNQEAFIKETLDSIFMQKVDFLVEVVVGDDFSNDKTLEIIKSYKDTDYIKLNILRREEGDNYWIKRQERGRLYNYLDILRNCQGEYIALMDGDDYWNDKHKLSKQVKFLDENPDYSIVSHEVHTSKFSIANTPSSAFSIFYYNFKYGNINSLIKSVKAFFTDRGQFWNMRVSHGGGFRINPYTFEKLINQKHFMATSSIMFRGEVVNKIHDCFTSFSGGHYFIVMLSLSLGKGFHIPEFLGFHRLHSNSISQNIDKNLFTKKVQATNQLKKFKCLNEIVEKREYKNLIKEKIFELEEIVTK